MAIPPFCEIVLPIKRATLVPEPAVIERADFRSLRKFPPRGVKESVDQIVEILD
jgi:hypothetical protein